ncbi:MAG: putative cobaltochelatase [Isosphaeraceae bacterium]
MSTVSQPVDRDPQAVYPFSALVGQAGMKRALILAAIHPGLGGVLIRGSKGAAKSTAVRALAALLPDILVYPGDPFRRAPGEEIGGEPLPGGIAPEPRPVALINLPVGATEDRVVGSMNLERALGSGTRSFEPGLLAAAHRGILYIDEVNLLGDHLVDLLLDAAAMGVNHVEREGLAFRHPARFVLVGTMNPEEGDLRPQLLDRFGLAVEVEPMLDPVQRAKVVKRRMTFEADPAGFRRIWEDRDRIEGVKIADAQQRLPSVVVPNRILDEICTRCAKAGAEGLRADITICKAATALAAYEGRTKVSRADVEAVAELALAHRRTISSPDPTPPSSPPPRNLDRRSPNYSREQEIREFVRDHHRSTPKRPPSSDESTAQVGEDTESSQAIPPSELCMVPGWEHRKDQIRRGNSPGRRGAPAAGARRGVSIRATVPRGRSLDPSIDATLRAAAPWQTGRGRQPGEPLVVRPIDLRDKVRRNPGRHLILFVVDSSRSMGARRRMAEAKATILSLLVEAYQKRDLVGLVTFGGTEAKVALPPTRSVRTAARLLVDLPVGGLTPLAKGLSVAGSLVTTTLRREPGLSPLIVLLSDGRGNVPLQAGGNPFLDVLKLVRQLAAAKVRGLVIDTETGAVRLGRAQEIARNWGAEARPLDNLAGPRLPEAVRRSLLAG